MEKNEYVVTKLAGRSIAGQRNPGLGGSIWLTEKQAEHLERVGQVKLVGDVESTEAPEPVKAPVAEVELETAAEEPKPRSRRKCKSDGGN